MSTTLAKSRSRMQSNQWAVRSMTKIHGLPDQSRHLMNGHSMHSQRLIGRMSDHVKIDLLFSCMRMSLFMPYYYGIWIEPVFYNAKRSIKQSLQSWLRYTDYQHQRLHRILRDRLCIRNGVVLMAITFVLVSEAEPEWHLIYQTDSRTGDTDCDLDCHWDVLSDHSDNSSNESTATTRISQWCRHEVSALPSCSCRTERHSVP